MTTPLERLDDAIHEYLTAVAGDDKAVTGWVLSASTTRLQADDDDILPLVSGQWYTLGPQTEVTQAIGLARFLDIAIDDAIRDQLAEDDDDPLH